MLRSLRNAVNPISTGLTRWWCQSSLRARLRGRPLPASARAQIRRRRTGPFPPMDEHVRRQRIAAIERVLGDGEQDDHR
jgi:hypothetical protein